MILETQNDYGEDGDTEAIFRGHLDHDDFIFWFAGPSMNSISATVCNEAGAGTDGEVGLHFTTSSNAVSLGDDDNFHRYSGKVGAAVSAGFSQEQPKYFECDHQVLCITKNVI